VFKVARAKSLCLRRAYKQMRLARAQVPTMTADDYFGDDEEQDTTNDSDESVSYIEISSLDHPEAYQVISAGGDVRDFFKGEGPSVDDFYADLSIPLAALLGEGDKVAMLDWLSPSEDDIEAYLAQREDDSESDD